jgi:hypothetical protein
MKYTLFFLFPCIIFLSTCSSLGKEIDETPSGSKQNQSWSTDESVRVEIPLPKTPEQALADFYTYLSEKKYPQAYILWDDSGKASGYDYPTFEKWYKSLEKSNYTVTGEKILRNTLWIASVEIPVEVTLTKKDKSKLNYTGSYTFIQNGTGEVLTAENSYWLIFSSKLEAKK